MIMSSDDYQIQNIYRYSRKSYKKNQRGVQENDVSSLREDTNIEMAETSPRSDGLPVNSPACSCDFDPEEEITNILHKKCPVITLAQQQLQRLLDETDKLLCNNSKCCRSVYDLICICKEIILTQNKSHCLLIALIAIGFIVGLIFGAASCGSHLGQFNSPILTCIDNFFIPNRYSKIDDTFRSIV